MEDLPLPLWAIILIPLCLGLVPFVYAAFERILEYRTAKRKLAASTTAGTAPSSNSDPKKLEARVRVLERIATDPGTGVALQIEALRNNPAEGNRP